MNVLDLDVCRDQGEEAGSVQYEQREPPHHTGTAGRRGGKRQGAFGGRVHSVLMHTHKGTEAD